MRQFFASLLLLCLMSGASLQAQFPFGRGPGFGPGLAMRPPMPPMPPMPVPGVYRPPLNYVRVPGANLIAPSPYIVPVAPVYGYSRPTLVVPVPLVTGSPYSAARVAVVQPSPISAAANRSAGENYRTEPRPTSAYSTSSELRPGMVLPDGAIVVSVGQPNSPNGQAQAPQTSTATVHAQSPTPAPVSAPASTGSGSNTQSILEAEEIPRPSVPESGVSSDKPAAKQF